MKRSYSILINVVALSLMVYLGTDIFYRVVGAHLRQVDAGVVVLPETPGTRLRRQSHLPDFRVIAQRNLFGAPQKAAAGADMAKVEALEPTSLDIVLLGTATGGKFNTYAVIKEKGTNKQGLFREGDSVQEAVIKKILRGKVVLRAGGRDEILIMKEPSSLPYETGRSKAATSTSTKNITINRKAIEASLKDVNKLLSQVRIRPHFKEGRPDGLVLARIGRSSIFSRLGLRSRDIIRKINGKPIKTTDDMVALYQELKSGAPISVELTRRNAPITINYRIR